jgi:hypothetical protein
VNNWHDLKGQTITKIECPLGDADIQIHTEQGGIRAHHASDCCESVDLIRVDGDTSTLIGCVVETAEEDAGCDQPEWYTDGTYESFTWTKLRLVAGGNELVFWVLGQSNGYYREELAFQAIGGAK